MTYASGVESGTERRGTSRLRCREIRDDDKNAIVDLLTEGFDRPRIFWVEALRRLSSHGAPDGLPRYGYALDHDGTLVGVLLLIFTAVECSAARAVRCNVSSWYVKPEYRAYAAMLVSRALKHREATYFNLTPAPGTLPILKAQGYRPLSTGRFYAVPALNTPLRGASVQAVDARATPDPDIGAFDGEVTRAHAGFGCLSLVCRTKDGAFPFVFARRRIKRYIPGALLIYCRRQEDFVTCAGSLGRFLASRGVLSVIINANGPIRGLKGKFVEKLPTFYLGPQPPQPGDLAFSECAMFGV